MGRRGFLKLTGLSGLALLVPASRWQKLLTEATGPTGGRFLDAHELDTLRAVCARLLPGPPEDPDPGAPQAGCAEAIDLLLGAFNLDPPLIYAGGPWSNRAGGRVDDMAHFVGLDGPQELAWRIRLEGSRDLPERSFAGQVTGLQEVYRDGLAQLDQAARPTVADFSSAPGLTQDALLRGGGSNFAGQVLSDALDALYGPPEYGGNRGLVGWKATRWPGDVQPRGYTDAQVTGPDPDRRRQPYPVGEVRDKMQSLLVGIQLLD